MNVATIHAEFSRRLSRLGRVVVAGGAVRDELMNRAPKDFDVFVFAAPSTDSENAVKEALADLAEVKPLAFHQSEPYLVVTVRYQGHDVQVMLTPMADTSALLDSFDWNVSLFAFDGAWHSRESIFNIAAGKPLRLQKVTFPASTLRRGFRFSERFAMEFSREDVLRLCREVVAKGAAV